jgi:hypothetical protein
MVHGGAAGVVDRTCDAARRGMAGQNRDQEELFSSKAHSRMLDSIATELQFKYRISLTELLKTDGIATELHPGRRPLVGELAQALGLLAQRVGLARHI